MGLAELVLLAVGLSMDAFAVAICAGLSTVKMSIKKALTVGLYFGFFQGAMPLIGYFAATAFADKIHAYSHWIAFGLLCVIGVKMGMDGFQKDGCPDRECPEGMCNDRTCPNGEKPSNKEQSLKPASMLPLAVATSIDALAVGVSFAVLQMRIIPAVSLIGVTTLVLSMAGFKIGNTFGVKYKSKAQIVGGLILVLIGLRILLEHLGII